jgi:hypothetical protein
MHATLVLPGNTELRIFYTHIRALFATYIHCRAYTTNKELSIQRGSRYHPMNS